MARRVKHSSNVNTTVFVGVPREVIKAALPEILDNKAEAARRFAPLGPRGNLRKSLRAKLHISGLSGTVSGYGHRGNHTHFVVSGTSSHEEVPTKHQAMRFFVGNHMVFSKGHVHTGAKKTTPFLDMAIEATAADDDRILQEKGLQVLDKSADALISPEVV